MPIQRRKSARMVRRSNTVAVVTARAVEPSSFEQSSSSAESNPNSGTGTETESDCGSNDQSIGKKWFALVISTSNRTIDETVKRWHELFAVDSAAAICKLVQYLLHFSGYTIDVNPKMLTSSEVQQVLQQHCLRMRVADYPLKSSEKHVEVRQFTLFVETFVKQLHDKIIHSDFYIENWYNWLRETSRSPLRPIRHSAIFTCLKWSRSLNSVGCNYIQSKQSLKQNRRGTLIDCTTQHISNTTLSNTLSSNTSPHSTLNAAIASLDSRIKATHKMAQMLDQVLEDSLFDCEPLIRSLCLQEFVQLIQLFPNLYVDDRFLNKIALMRVDPFPKVQTNWYELAESMLKLPEQSNVIRKFFDDVLEDLLVVANENDHKLSVPAINLLNDLYKVYPDLFEEDQLSILYLGIFSLDMNIAKVSAIFLMNFLKKDIPNLAQELPTLSGKRVNNNVSILYNLVKFYETMTFVKKAKFLTNTLINVHPVMTGWQSYVDLLNEVILAFPFNLTEQVALVDLLLHFIKRCVKLPRDNNGRKRDRQTGNEKVTRQKHREDITSVFVISLVPLLRKFRGCNDVVSRLVKIGQYFSLQFVTRFSMETNELLLEINQIIDIHHDVGTLRACFKVYREWMLVEGPVKIIAKSMFETALESLCTKFGLDWNLTPQLSDVQFGASKLLIASLFHDLSPFSVWRNVYAHLLKEHYLFEDESFCLLMLTGCRSYLIRELDRYRNVTEHDLSEMKQQIFDSFEFSRVLMNKRNSFRLRRLGFLNASDMLVCFGRQITQSRCCIRQLHYVPDDNTLNLMCSFMDEDLPAEVAQMMSDDNEIARLIELKRYMLAFVKLILFGIFSFEAVPHFLQHYALVSLELVRFLLDRFVSF